MILMLGTKEILAKLNINITAFQKIVASIKMFTFKYLFNSATCTHL